MNCAKTVCLAHVYMSAGLDVLNEDDCNSGCTVQKYLRLCRRSRNLVLPSASMQTDKRS